MTSLHAGRNLELREVLGSYERHTRLRLLRELPREAHKELRRRRRKVRLHFEGGEVLQANFRKLGLTLAWEETEGPGPESWG